jgi:hypothetical protein
MVESKQTNINRKLREFNDYIIKDVDYFRVNREYWDIYFKGGTDIEITKQRYIGTYGNKEFIDKFFYVLGKSRVYKNLVINEIPRILYYYTVKKDNSIVPSISLKKLQLIEEGYNIKFDFSMFQNFADIPDKEVFREYSKNDVDFLWRYFNKYCLDGIKKRWYAVKGANSIQPIDLDDSVLYTENNTALIVELLKIPEKQEVEINYLDHIQTNHKKFNDFVEFMNTTPLQRDYEAKKAYAELYQLELDNSADKNIVEGTQVEVLANNFDKIQLGDCICGIGTGGLHGAIPNYQGTNLFHLDYDSQYPSIILQYQEHFSKIMNVELYKGVYELRIASKYKMKELQNKIDEAYAIIEKGGNDGADIEEYGPQIEEWKKELKELELIVDGLKLILNSTFGLINSNFNIPIAHKKLGRFITLKGQSLIINLADKILSEGKDCKLVNLNTDGVIGEGNPPEIPADGYFKLGKIIIEKMIQRDVNSYIKIEQGGKHKVKGEFNIKLKRNINTNEKLSVNLKNAVNMWQGKAVKILPIYFNQKLFEAADRAYYFTNSKYGQTMIKKTVKPEVLGLNNELFYFTTDKEKTDISYYRQYAALIYNKLLNFELEKKEIIKYYEIELTNDTEDNIKLKSSMKRKLAKLLETKNLGLIGFKGDPKAACLYFDVTGKPRINKQLAHYTMTPILKSTFCHGFDVYSINDDLLIIDVDIYDHKTKQAKPGWQVCLPFINNLKAMGTFECWNQLTKKYNRKFIFKGNKDFKLPDELKKYIEVTKKAVVWSLYDYDCNMETIKDYVI